MLKLIFHTLVGVFLVLLIAGRDTEQGRLAAAAAAPDAGRITEKAARSVNQLTSLLDSPAVETQEAPMIIRASATQEIVTPASATTAPAPRIRMPGPALSPSPEHRVKAEASAGDGALYVVETNRLNVRSGPSTGNPVIDSIERGEEVLVISDSSARWVRIRIEGDGVEGWVARSLLRPVR